MAESKTDERLREVEVTLATHLATCDASSKSAAAVSKAVRSDIKNLSDKVEGLRQDRDRVHGGAQGSALVFKIIGGVLVAASLFANIYMALNR